MIKSRGISSLNEYLELTRIGRRTPLRREQREAVWILFEAYEARLRSERHHDYTDQVRLALTSLRAEPLENPYTAVIVDEVQDLTSVGLQLVHQLVGDRPDGLFLVGDGQQAVYPGGFTLVEAGVSVVGRATILDRNYRNASEILTEAMAVVYIDDYDDLESESVSGRRLVTTERNGGSIVKAHCQDESSLGTALSRQVADALAVGERLGDMAVLCRTNTEVAAWLRHLESQGLAAIGLDAYEGRVVDAMKVGTYQRSKGLEFSRVFLPEYDRAIKSQTHNESDEACAERAVLERRQLFVAMTRARDGLWSGSVAR